MKKIKAIRGIRDIVYPDSSKWTLIVNQSRRILRRCGFRDIYLPALEYTSLFTGSIGEDTDIVEKEMYSFKDKKGRDLSLRPEGTASAVRAMIENRLLEGRVREKVMYFGPMFRYEKPQSGRYRQFYQLGCEVFGSSSVYSDVEITEIAAEVLKASKIKDFILKVNSIGCEECRNGYIKKLKEFLSTRAGRLCSDCRRRIDTNILRVLDCKKNKCREEYRDIPSMENFLCGDCGNFFDSYLNILKRKEISFKKDPRLVRGLDYYTGVVFEVESDSDIILAGGRYDNLVADLGGAQVPACGWALGLDRLAEKSQIKPKKNPWLYIALLKGGEPEAGEELASRLRELDISVELDCEKISAGKKFKMAHRRGASFVAVIGGEEMKKSSVSVKNMKSGKQDSFAIDDIDRIREHIKC